MKFRDLKVPETVSQLERVADTLTRYLLIELGTAWPAYLSLDVRLSVHRRLYPHWNGAPRRTSVRVKDSISLVLDQGLSS